MCATEKHKLYKKKEKYKLEKEGIDGLIKFLSGEIDELKNKMNELEHKILSILGEPQDKLDEETQKAFKDYESFDPEDNITCRYIQIVEAQKNLKENELYENVQKFFAYKNIFQMIFRIKKALNNNSPENNLYMVFTALKISSVLSNHNPDEELFKNTILEYKYILNEVLVQTKKFVKNENFEKLAGLIKDTLIFDITKLNESDKLEEINNKLEFLSNRLKNINEQIKHIDELGARKSQEANSSLLKKKRNLSQKNIKNKKPRSKKNLGRDEETK